MARRGQGTAAVVVGKDPVVVVVVVEVAAAARCSTGWTAEVEGDSKDWTVAGVGVVVVDNRG